MYQRPRVSISIILAAASAACLFASIVRASIGPAPVATPVLLVGKTQVTEAELSADARLADIVAAKLFLDRFISREAVHVSAKDGVVRIEGTVADLREAELVRKMAEAVRGVRKVDSALQVPTVVRPDAELALAVRTELASDPSTDVLGISVAAHQGVLELTGRVSLRSARELAVWVAEGVPGVRELVNHIRVTPPETEPSSRELTVALRSRYRMDAWLGEDPIQVSVAGGKATLTGVVSSAAEYSRALADAGIPGVLTVDSRGLKVDPSVRDRAPSALIRRELVASDDNLRADILEMFRYDARLDGHSPQVTVRDRVATLRGTVEDLSEKLSAEDDAWNVGGVIDLRDELEVQLPNELKDEDLALSVTRALRSGLPTETWNHLAMTVKKGAVIVTGTVGTAYERWQAHDIASRTRGVLGLDNRIRVVPVIEGTRQAGLSDEEIRDRATVALKWDPLLGADDQVQVEISSGVATLTGRVKSPERAVQAARDAFDAGVHGVKSTLLIVGSEDLPRLKLERGKRGGGIVTTGGAITYTAPPAETFPSFREPQS